MPSFSHPLDALRHHVSGAIARGEGAAIAGIPAEPLFAYVTTDSDGETLATFTAEENPSCDHWAQHYAREILGEEVDADCLNKPRSYIPSGGDFTVTIATQFDFHNGAACYASRNYYLAR